MLSWPVLLAAVVTAPLQLEGFPASLGLKNTGRGVLLVDLDGDQTQEIVVVAGAGIAILNQRGETWPGFPVVLESALTQRKVSIEATPLACDVNGDGRLDLVVATDAPELYAISPQGKAVAPYPIALSAPTRGELSCSGKGAQSVWLTTERGHVLQVTKGESKVFASVGDEAETGVALADLDSDGTVEVIVGGGKPELHVWRADGRVRQGFPYGMAYRTSGVPSVGDVNDDGRLDIVFGSQDFKVHAIGGDGKPLPGFPFATGYRVYAGPALADLDEDGVLDIVAGSGDSKIYALSGAGKPLPGFPVDVKNRVIGGCVVGDLDRDGHLEIGAVTQGGTLHVIDRLGKHLPGYPYSFAGKNEISPAMGDLDGDGLPELVAATPGGEVYAFALKDSKQAEQALVSWPMLGHDAQHTGRYGPYPARYKDLGYPNPGPGTDDNLSLHYAYFDLDGDPEQDTQVRWYRDGQHQKALDNLPLVKPALTRKHERWHFTLQEGSNFKRYGESAKLARIATSVPVEIRNTPPGAPQIALTPTTPTTSDTLKVAVVRDSTDVDGDKSTYKIRWLKDGVQQRDLSENSVGPNLTDKGQVWEVVLMPNDAEADGVEARAQVVIANTPPGTPVIALSPAQPRATDPVVVQVTTAAADVDGDAVQYVSHYWVNDVPLNVAATPGGLPAGNLRKGDRLKVRVTAHDGEADGGFAESQLTVVNTAPPAPSVAIAPLAPQTRHDLSPRIEGQVADIDGDSLRYVQRWLRDGKPTTLGAVVAAHETRKGEAWELETRVSDGSSESEPARARVVIGNTPPRPPRLQLEPSRPTTLDGARVRITVPASDDDNDTIKLTYRWSADGVRMPKLDGRTELAAREARKGQRWRVDVVPSDGTAEGEPAFLEWKVMNAAPAAPSLIVEPAQPTTVAPVAIKIAAPAADPDGDKIGYRYRWFVDGSEQPWPADRAALPAGTLKKGQQCRVEVVADDGLAQSDAVSVAFIVANQPPSPAAAKVTPERPRTSDDLTAVLTQSASDADGDTLSYRHVWLRNGQVQAYSGQAVPASATTKGDVWELEVWVSDGVSESAATRVSVAVENTPPRPPVLELEHAVPTAIEAIQPRVAVAAQDADGDAVKLFYRWSVDGHAAVQLAGRTALKPGETRKGQKWRLEVVPSDGQVDGPAAVLEWHIANAAPRAPAVAIVPERPTSQDTVAVQVTAPASDTDGDKLRYLYRWIVDGTERAWPQEKASLAAGETKRGQHWRVEVVASDGEQLSPWVVTEFDVGNVAPQPPGLKILPEQPRSTDDLNCSMTKPASDADGDAVSYRLRWLRNGEVQPFEGPTTPSAWTRKGERWTCEAMASDGELSSSAVRAQEVSIQNSVPQAASIVLEPAKPTAATPLYCRIVVRPVDVDGDALRYKYRWRRDGKPVEGVAEVVSPQTARRGEVWSCALTAHDGTAEGPAANAEARIDNTPPTVPHVGLQPEAPQAGDTIRCNLAMPSSDLDGDKITYSYVWLRNGERQGFATTSAEVPGRLVKSRDIWQCRVLAADAIANSKDALSPEIVVR